MKIDLKRRYRTLYAPGPDVAEVDVPPFTYLAIDGHGDPNTAPAYADTVAALYAAAYATKFAAKAHDVDFVVGPLEGLWSSADPASFAAGTKADWDWTMLIALPDEVTADDAAAGRAKAARSKPALPVAEVRTEVIDEGRCLQLLHVGGYDAEAPVLARLHRDEMPSRGLTWNGRHHEIYLSDPRRVAPGQLKTVLRQPVRPL